MFNRNLKREVENLKIELKEQRDNYFKLFLKIELLANHCAVYFDEIKPHVELRKKGIPEEG